MRGGGGAKETWTEGREVDLLIKSDHILATEPLSRD